MKALALAAGLATVLASALPAYAAVWIPGHWVGGRFIPGHYAAGPGPRVAVVVPHRVWIPGHYQGGVFIGGHWAVQ